jgi:hypothetical protein
MCEDRTNNNDTGIVPLCVIAFVVLVFFALVLHAEAAGPVAPILPDPKLTPGVAGTLTAAQLCAKGFTTKSIRNVTEDEKAAVYARYGAKDHKGICNCPVTDKKTGKIRNEGCEVDRA